jgi:hypothetical protein
MTHNKKEEKEKEDLKTMINFIYVVENLCKCITRRRKN